MFRTLLTFIGAGIALLAPAGLARAQGLLPLSTGQGQANGVRGLSQDSREWAGPLVAVNKEEQRFFRTFCFGWIRNTAASFHVDGGYMMGLEINISDPTKDPVINSLRPIYSAADGRKAQGEQIGSSKGKLERLVAKPGYAITAVTISEITAVNGIKVRFSRVKPDGTCDLADSYESPTYGQGGGTIIEVADEKVAIPFSGMYITPGDPKILDGFAFLVSQNLVRTHAPGLLPRARGQTVSMREMFPSPPPAPVPAPSREIVVIREVNPALQARISEILREATQRLILVQGSDGRGSGFVYRIGGKPFCATNQHVVAGNTRLQFSSLGKGPLKLGPAQAAVGHDLMVAAVAEDTLAFDAVADITKEVAMGDAVIVLGDSEGAGVVRPIAGTVLGIGPNLIEVSAEFVEGNSGSPILHVKSGKVIGIASYASVKMFDAGAEDIGVQVRRFGYRLDSVKQWQPLDWATFHAEATACSAGRSFTDALQTLYQSVRTQTFVPASHKDPRLQQALARLPQRLATAPTPQQRAQYIDGFLRELRNTTKFQSDDLRRRLRYDHFQREIETETKLREMIIAAIEGARENIPVAYNVKPIPTRRPAF